MQHERRKIERKAYQALPVPIVSMDAPPTFTFKVSYADDLRRWTANRSVGYDELRSKICDIFKLPASFTLKYRDEDGDIVTIGTECDLKECFAQKLSPIRLFVYLDALSKTAEDELSEPGYSKQAKGKAPVASDESKSAQATEKSSDVPPSTSFINPLLSVLFRVCPDFDINAIIPKHKLESIPDHVLSKFVSRADEVISGKTPPEKLLAEFFSALSAEIGTGSTDTKAYPSSNPCSSSDLNTVLHHGVTCDGCGQSPIQGPRYKSLSKEDFDLCSACEASKKPEWNGLYARMDKPDLTVGGWTSMDKPEPIRASPDQGLNEPPFHPFKGMHPLRNRCRGFFRGGGAERRDGHYPQHWRRGGWAGKGGPASSPGSAWSPPGHYSASQPAYRLAQPCLPPKSSPKPAPTSNEKLDSRFVSDVTVFDGTQMAPGQIFSKIWRLRNTGEVTWPKGTSLVHIGGDLMGLLAVGVTMPEGGVPPNTELDVHVEMTAPSRPGRYVTYYRLAVPSDNFPVNTTPYRFGQRFWALIQVVDFDAYVASAPGGPPPSPSSPPSAEAATALEASLQQQPICSKEASAVKATPGLLPCELVIEDPEYPKESPVDLMEQEHIVQKEPASAELEEHGMPKRAPSSELVEEYEEDFPAKNVYADSQVGALPEHLDQEEPPVMVKQDDFQGVSHVGDGISDVPCLSSLYGAESSDIETSTPCETPKTASGDDFVKVLQASSDEETHDEDAAIAPEANCDLAVPSEEIIDKWSNLSAMACHGADAAAAQAADVELAADIMPFALETQQLHDMGFNDMMRNIALLEKHNGDLLQTVEELMTSFPEDGADLEWENVSDSERFEEV